MIKVATFCDQRVYRYVLWRVWDERKPCCMFVGLNPSTADENVEDPTVRRCMGFASRWGYGGLCMTNLFAYRSTDPSLLVKQRDPVGPLNDEYLKWAANNSGLVIAAWGNHGSLNGRSNEVRHD